MYLYTNKTNKMAVRNQNSRQSTNTVTLSINGIILTLIPKDWTVGKSYLYYVKAKILSGKIQLPSIEEKTGTNPFLLGYCHKSINNGVEFVWN